jgi:hypothetical protein
VRKGTLNDIQFNIQGGLSPECVTSMIFVIFVVIVQVLTAASVTKAVLWVIAVCSLVVPAFHRGLLPPSSGR